LARIRDLTVFTYTKEFAEFAAVRFGLYRVENIPHWLIDNGFTFEQWVSTKPMQGVTGKTDVTPITDLPIVWKAWNHLRAEIEARYRIHLGLFETYNLARASVAFEGDTFGR